MTSPIVFVSYSHDSPEHRKWVCDLATRLRENGVDAILDQWDLSPGQDITLFMQQGITRADRVLLICSEKYISKAEAGQDGVGFERLIVTAEVIASIETKKFIPIVRNNTSSTKVPVFLGPRLYVDFSEDSKYDEKFLELLHEIFGVPQASKPPLGENPFSGQIPNKVSLEPSTLQRHSRNLDDKWFQAQNEIAVEGLKKLDLLACMDLRFGLHEEIKKSQMDLITSIRRSEIKTFGWPIGITLENREEFKPRPYNDGIRAEIALKESSFSGRTSYDYWALRSNGDFFLAQSLFEDTREEKMIFFNTRIVRVTEAILFASKLYANLGSSKDAEFNIRIGHRGLAGRELGSSNPGRFVTPGRKCVEETCEVEVVVKLGNIEDSLIEYVEQLTSPLFELFDFMSFSSSVYEDIVTNFRNGRVT